MLRSGWLVHPSVRPSCVSLTDDVIFRQQGRVGGDTFDVHVRGVHVHVVLPDERGEYR